MRIRRLLQDFRSIEESIMATRHDYLTNHPGGVITIDDLWEALEYASRRGVNDFIRSQGSLDNWQTPTEGNEPTAVPDQDQS